MDNLAERDQMYFTVCAFREVLLHIVTPSRAFSRQQTIINDSVTL